MLGGTPLGGHIGSRASELLDGRLSAEEEHRLRLHIGRCSTCAALVAAQQDARAALRRAAIPESLAPSESLLSGLLALGAPAPTPDSVVRGLDAATVDDLPGGSPAEQQAGRRLRVRLPNW